MILTSWYSHTCAIPSPLTWAGLCDGSNNQIKAKVAGCHLDLVTKGASVCAPALALSWKTCSGEASCQVNSPLERPSASKELRPSAQQPVRS